MRAMARVPIEALGPARSCSPSGSGPLRERHVQPRRDQPEVVVAGDQHHLAVGAQGLADGLEHGPRGLQRVVHRAVAQLEQVAEDDEPVDAVEGAEQRLLGGGPAQDVDVVAGPEVEV